MRFAQTMLCIGVCGMPAATLTAAAKKPPVAIRLAWSAPDADFKVKYLESISSPADLSIRKSFLSRLGDLVLGADGRFQGLARPFAVKVDSHGRLLVADPAAPGVHVLDAIGHKSRILRGPSRTPLKSPV